MKRIFKLKNDPAPNDLGVMIHQYVNQDTGAIRVNVYSEKCFRDNKFSHPK